MKKDKYFLRTKYSKYIEEENRKRLIYNGLAVVITLVFTAAFFYLMWIMSEIRVTRACLSMPVTEMVANKQCVSQLK